MTKLELLKWIEDADVMTGAEVRLVRKYFDISQDGLAQKLGMGANGGRNVRRWESGETRVNPQASLALSLMLKIVDVEPKV